MTAAQRRLKELRDRQSKERQRMAELGMASELTAETRAELDAIEAGTPDLERQIRAATVAAEAEEAEQRTDTRDDGGEDAEAREKRELRAKARVTGFIEAALRGRLPAGAEAEYAAAVDVSEGIPMDLWETERAPATATVMMVGRDGVRPVEVRADAPTPAPGTVGVNLQPIRPEIFAPSVLPSLGIAMPRVPSGTYAEATITGGQTAGSHAKGSAADSTAATFAVQTATPKRISARMSVRIEDIASVGQSNFEAALRANISAKLSEELDDQGLNGAGGNSGADLIGLFQRLTDPTAPGTVATFDDFAAIPADAIDGLWASTVRDVALLAGVETYRLSAKTFQTATNYKGELSAAAYLEGAGSGGWRTNERMPAKVSEVEQGIAYRNGRMMLTAVCPQWGSITIDDIYSGSASGERYVTFHALVGDVIVVQPAAYGQFAIKVA